MTVRATVGFPSATDTIVAIATATGGGVGVIRLSGSRAQEVAQTMFRPSRPGFSGFVPRMLHYGHILDDQQRVVDEVLAVFFPAPASFTGEDVVEIHGHGGAAGLHAIVNLCLEAGARQAERGEFTRRAFLNGRMDLTQAEAVAELVAAPGLEGARLASAKLDGLLGKRVHSLRQRLEYLRQRLCLAIDFPDEEGECLSPVEFTAIVDEVLGEIDSLTASYERARHWQEGALVVLAGQVNAGKSSLMNALLGRPRAIVTALPGTTRDYLEEQTSLDGLPVRLVDTAGLRDNSHDPVELEGMRLSRELAAQAQVVLVLLDATRATGLEVPATEACFAAELALVRDLGPERCLLVWNKADVVPLPPGQNTLGGLPITAISAQSGQGVDCLASLARRMCGAVPPGPGEIAPNMRQWRSLKKAAAELRELHREIAAAIPPDLCGLRLEAAAMHLADITGLNTAEETLNAIFEDFCIGK